MITLTGKKISEGIAIGRLSFYKRDIKEIKKIYVKDVEKEIAGFERSREKAIQELEGLYENSLNEVGEANAAIFESQKMILQDDLYADTVIKMIIEEKLNAEYVVKSVSREFTKHVLSQKKAYTGGYESDIHDVSLRLIRILSRSWKDKMLMDEPFILACGELYPSEALQLDKNKVLGFVTLYGTINSHTAVLARTRGLPAIVGLGEVLKEEYEGKTVIVNGYDGKVYIEPDYSTLTRMKERQNAASSSQKNLERLKGKENVTQSGQRIEVCANVKSREDIENVLRSDAGGIGLFRTEYLYMENEYKLPTEEQLFQVFKLSAEAMGTYKVVIRLADFGGKKIAESIDLGEYKNPIIGARGVRFLLDREDILMPLLRAILRASAYGNVSLLLPMVSSVYEVSMIKEKLNKAKETLKEEKTPFNRDILIGAMLETPASIMISGELSREVDFFSIGTNDLTQLALGIDMDDPRLSTYYNPHHPALLKMIRIVTNNVHLEGKTISICGDLAADLSMTESFMQMGVDELSVAPNQVLGLRKKIREIK